MSWCRVSLNGTHPTTPAFDESGITEYREIERSRLLVV
jgi:hypothetical protein